MTGGGSGGHITPLLAVAHELKQLEPDIRLFYIGQKGDKLSDVPQDNPDINEAYFVRAGKFRRYSGEGLKQLVDVPTFLKNARDATRVIYGLAECNRLLRKIRPDIILIKGGSVGVPVGLAAAQLHIPFITHDSDAIPGLANRIIAKWARLHAVALPKELYPYPPNKTVTVGVPISSEFVPVTSSLEKQYRTELDLSNYDQILFVTGGGNGARQLNSEVVKSAKQILQKFPKLVIVHVAGRAFETETRSLYYKSLPEALLPRVIVKNFVPDLYRYSGAADLVIARGSATNLAEFAIQSKACIIIPASQLVWTVKNAETLTERHAALVIKETDLVKESDYLAEACIELLDKPTERRQLGENLANLLSHPRSARELAELLLNNIG